MIRPLLTIRALDILNWQFHDDNPYSQSHHDWEVYRKRVDKLKKRIHRELTSILGEYYDAFIR